MAHTVAPIAFEITADVEAECASACADVAASQPPGTTAHYRRPVHCGDRRWRAVLTLRRIAQIAELPDWCAEA